MAKADLTAELLRELLHYDRETGIFTRLASNSPRSSVGDVVGCIDRSNGYIKIGVNSWRWHAHRLAWLYVYGYLPTGQIDHINGIRDDNRIANLRDVTCGENQQNRRHPQKDNALGILGVSCVGGKYLAHIKLQRKSIYLGTFQTPELAYAAYVSVKRKIHPACTI